MLYAVKTTKSPEQAGKELEAAAARHRFGVLAVHDLQASMAKHGLTFDRACRIYEVCQPQQAHRVLSANMSIATVLPCRIVVYAEPQGSTIAMIRPTALIDLFRAPGFKQVAQDVERELIAIIDESR